jgi:Baseplate J-like protein
MAEIKTLNGNAVIDYMARDYNSLLNSMQQLVATKLPEWKEYKHEADFGNILLQLSSHMGDIIGYYQDRVVNESFLGTAQERTSIIHHLRLIGYTLATAAPASAVLQVTVPGTVVIAVTINKGDAFGTKSQKDKPSVRFEYTGETGLTIDFNDPSQYELINGKKIFTGIPIEEGRLIKEEVIGISDGTANQRFQLVHPRLILRSLGVSNSISKDTTLVSFLGMTPQEWTLQESLAFSRESQHDYVIEIDDQDRAFVIFGDGDFGAIPSAGSELRVSYRVGGGESGNVVAESIGSIIAAPQLALLGAKVSNPAAATGGADRESIQHAVNHAPSVFRSLKRAVTAEDYKALALDFKGVGKVRAEKKNWNTVTLYVAPQGGGYISDVLKQNLLAYFEDKRPLSTMVEVEDVDYVKIYISADIGIESYYSSQDIFDKVSTSVSDLLAFDNVDFGQTLYLSKFYEALEAIEGVASVFISEFRNPDDAPGTIAESGKITLSQSEVPVVPDDLLADADYIAGINITEEV